MKVIIESIITQCMRNNKGISTITIKTGKISQDQFNMIGKEVSLKCELVLTVE